MSDYLEDLDDIICGSRYRPLTWKDVFLRLGIGCIGLTGISIICLTMLMVAAIHAGAQ